MARKQQRRGQHYEVCSKDPAPRKVDQASKNDPTKFEHYFDLSTAENHHRGIVKLLLRRMKSIWTKIPPLVRQYKSQWDIYQMISFSDHTLQPAHNSLIRKIDIEDELDAQCRMLYAQILWPVVIGEKPNNIKNKYPWLKRIHQSPEIAKIMDRWRAEVKKQSKVKALASINGRRAGKNDHGQGLGVEEEDKNKDSSFHEDEDSSLDENRFEDVDHDKQHTPVVFFRLDDVERTGEEIAREKARVRKKRKLIQDNTQTELEQLKAKVSYQDKRNRTHEDQITALQANQHALIQAIHRIEAATDDQLAQVRKVQQTQKAINKVLHNHLTKAINVQGETVAKLEKDMKISQDNEQEVSE